NRCLWVVVLLLLGSPLLASESGVIVRDAPVYADADSSARKVGRIDAGTRVNIFSRRGGWEEIFAEGENLVGWVRSYQVRGGKYAPPVETGAETDSRGFLSGLAAFSRKASRFFSSSSQGSNSSTATIGVRGLSEEEINSARPDPAEFVKMQGYASNQQRMARFQLEGQLSVNQVKHLKTAKKDREKQSREK
ncbi:MAG: SH3 domain-containing protein, partial [Gammaproteobacteria bacterium]